MSKTASVKKENPKIKIKHVESILLALISIIMLIAPFYRGLFFRVNYIPATAAIGLIFAIYLVYKLSNKGYTPINTYLDLAVFAIPLCYLISFIFGVNAKDGLDMVLVYASYFMVYKIVSDNTKNDENRRHLFVNAIIIIVFVVAISSLLALFGVIDIKGAVEANRLFGPYQYPNTTASVLGVGIILTINALVNTEKLTYILAYQAILATLLSAFVFTLSRGGFITLISVLMLNFLVIRPKEKIKFVLNILVSALASSLVIFNFYTSSGTNTSNMMLYYSISILAALLITYAFYLLRKRINIQLSDRKINIALIVIVLFFAGIVVFLFSAKIPSEYKIEHAKGEEKSWKNKSVYIADVQPNSIYELEFNVKSSLENKYSYGVIARSYNTRNEFTEIYNKSGSVGNEFQHKEIEIESLADTQRIQLLLYNYEADSYTIYKDIVVRDSQGNIIKKFEEFKYIPKAIADRLNSINLKTDGATTRIYFIKDGLKLFSDNALIGAGGGAWGNLYRKYQSISYDSTQTHSFFVQYATEVGLLGLVPLTFILLQLIIGFIKSMKGDTDYLPAYLAVLLIFLHSAIDFNLSLIASAYILWTLVGVLNTDDNTLVINIKKNRAIHICILALSIISVMISCSIYYGIDMGSKAEKIISSKTDKEESIALYEKAIKFDRFNAAYQINYAQIMRMKYLETKDIEYYNKMTEHMNQAMKYEPYEIKYRSAIVNFMLSNGQFDEAAGYVGNIVKTEPLLAQSYILKIDTNYEIAKYYFSSNLQPKALPYLENMIKAKEEYDATNSQLEKPMKMPKDYDMKTDLAMEWLDVINKNKK